MEPLFYNKRIMTHEHAKSVYNQIGIKQHIMYLILELVYLALNIYFIYFYGINILAAILLISFVIIHATRPHTYAKKRIKEYNALHNATEVDETLFFADHLLSRDLNTKSELKIEYNRITKVKTTKNLYVFYIKDSKTRIITDKNIIPKGTNENFEEFIKNRISHSD